ncbi:unnamed protein product, partial [Polarella glacialis]
PSDATSETGASSDCLGSLRDNALLLPSCNFGTRAAQQSAAHVPCGRGPRYPGCQGCAWAAAETASTSWPEDWQVSSQAVCGPVGHHRRRRWPQRRAVVEDGPPPLEDARPRQRAQPEFPRCQQEQGGEEAEEASDYEVMLARRSLANTWESKESRRYRPKSEEEMKRLEEEVKVAKAQGEPLCRSVPAEEALVRIANLDGFYYLDVEEIMTLDRETREDLDALCKAKKPRGHVSLGLIVLWSVWERQGLPRELRVSSPELAPVVTLVRPTAQQLAEYVMRNQPVVIKGALNSEKFPPLEDFANFGYLRERCGHRMIKVKSEAFVDKENRQIFVSDPLGEMSLSAFCGLVEQAEHLGVAAPVYMGKVKLDDSVPELVEDLADCPAGPMQQFAECFGSNVKGAHTYFGCGKNTTAIHCDPSENLLVVITGTKTFDLYPPSDADCLYLIRQPNYLNSCLPPFVSPDAMPDEMAAKYPLYRHARVQRVELVAGDMLYLPIFWWHGVTGGFERNMIINWWCEMHPDKMDKTDSTLEGSAMALIEAVREHLGQTQPSPSI